MNGMRTPKINRFRLLNCAFWTLAVALLAALGFGLEWLATGFRVKSVQWWLAR